MKATLASVVAAGALAASASGVEPAEAPIEATLVALAAELDPRAAATLQAIDDTGRKLLAARAYLRAASQLDERWSWSASEAANFEGTLEKLALDDAIARVRCAFEAGNPGYTLWVNPEFRSLEVQLLRWNQNDSVARAGDDLLAVVKRAFDAPDAPRAETTDAAAALSGVLLSHQPVPAPTLAAPGLSPHGRMRAIDFQVEASGRIVAGTETSTIQRIWLEDGWKERLKTAVHVADAGFIGPLATPDEPWHYEYHAGTGGGREVSRCVQDLATMKTRPPPP